MLPFRLGILFPLRKRYNLIMYKRILVAVNEHLNSEAGARYGLEFAKVAGSKLYLVFIAERGISPLAIKNAESAIGRLFESATNMGIDVEAITKTGEPVSEIDSIVRAEGIDLAFVSTRRADIERRFFSGTTARRLSARLHSSVALVRVVHAGKIHPKSVLVPLKAKLDYIKERAHFISIISEAFGSELYVFHVRKPSQGFLSGEVELTTPEWERRFTKDIVRFINIIKKHGIAPHLASISGDVGRAITLEALARRHDLIVMGASRRSLLRSIIGESPVEEILRETPCNLIILNPRHHI